MYLQTKRMRLLKQDMMFDHRPLTFQHPQIMDLAEFLIDFETGSKRISRQVLSQLEV